MHLIKFIFQTLAKRLLTQYKLIGGLDKALATKKTLKVNVSKYEDASYRIQYGLTKSTFISLIFMK